MILAMRAHDHIDETCHDRVLHFITHHHLLLDQLWKGAWQMQRAPANEVDNCVHNRVKGQATQAAAWQALSFHSRGWWYDWKLQAACLTARNWVNAALFVALIWNYLLVTAELIWFWPFLFRPVPQNTRTTEWDANWHDEEEYQDVNAPTKVHHVAHVAHVGVANALGPVWCHVNNDASQLVSLLCKWYSYEKMYKSIRLHFHKNAAGRW